MTSVLPELTFGLLILLGGVVAADKPKKHKLGPQARASIKASLERVQYFPVDALAWADAGPNLPPGTKIALLDGDPAVPNQPFTYRLMVPAGGRLPPHAHPADEHVTIISGELLSGLGEKWDDKAMRPMPAGSYYALPAGTHHYALVTKDCVMQMHGIGPWEIHYVNPEDDPQRKAARAAKAD